jgi:hypothetical protein
MRGLTAHTGASMRAYVVTANAAIGGGGRFA